MTLEDIYIENYPVVYGYLLSMCADPIEAEEIAAETFLKALQSIRRYDGKCKPATWLCTIARNLYINELKRKKRYIPLEEARIPAVPDMQEHYIEKDAVARLYQSASELESPYRDVFFLRIKGLDFRQIAQQMGKTENWARVIYYRAKTKIRQEEEYNG